jgi:hypothetical protein
MSEAVALGPPAMEAARDMVVHNGCHHAEAMRTGGRLGRAACAEANSPSPRPRAPGLCASRLPNQSRMLGVPRRGRKLLGSPRQSPVFAGAALAIEGERERRWG